MLTRFTYWLIRDCPLDSRRFWLYCRIVRWQRREEARR